MKTEYKLNPTRYAKSAKNIERADTVENHILRFQAEQNMRNENLEDIVSDFLCNLQHYCRQNKVHFDTVLRRAEGHYEVESKDMTGDK